MLYGELCQASRKEAYRKISGVAYIILSGTYRILYRKYMELYRELDCSYAGRYVAHWIGTCRDCVRNYVKVLMDVHFICDICLLVLLLFTVVA